jgi:hypothetical protein
LLSAYLVLVIGRVRRDLLVVLVGNGDTLKGGLKIGDVGHDEEDGVTKAPNEKVRK